MFAGDTNLLHEDKNIINLFTTINEELRNINDWFVSKKLSLSFCLSLSLNVAKVNYSLFRKYSRVDDLPFKLPKLSMNNQEIKREFYTKFLCFSWIKNLSWKEYIIYTENKIPKSVGIMYTKLNLSYIRFLYCHCIFLTFFHT